MPARTNGKRSRAPAGRSGAKGKGAKQLPPDMEDEIDLFHKSKDKLAFDSDGSDADMDHDMDDDDAVLNIEADSGSDDDEDLHGVLEGDLDSDEEIEAALARGGHDAERTMLLCWWWCMMSNAVEWGGVAGRECMGSGYNTQYFATPWLLHYHMHMHSCQAGQGVAPASACAAGRRQRP